MKPLLSSLLLISLLLVPSSVSLKIPRLRGLRRRSSWSQGRLSESSLVSDPTVDLHTYYYNQTLDHFNFRPDSFTIFQQRYLINYKHWGGSNISAPVLAFLGGENSIDHYIPAVGFLNENANTFQALQIFLEHRYYGKSIPFGSEEVAFRNASTLGYFNSAQAIADYAEILMHVKKQLHAEHSPVIVVGGSYDGSSACCMVSAKVSSAPILYFDDIIPPEAGYSSIVIKDFRDVSETCYQIIKKSWSEIDYISSQPEGLKS